MSREPSRGEIWLADLHPIRGHEQAGTRPVLIVSTDIFNHGPAGLVFVLPLTRTDRRIPAHIPLEPPEGGVRSRSLILCDALRSVSKDRLKGNPWGSVSQATLQRVEETLRMLLDL
ncbi:type II toxin-antitoxin system PemK/MazF family toxin [Candidatus Chloroploca sp. Khr17]|uniref:type II toxin-antitoxin system PemK/MazF family toxin n=1 Tax=Candidatus Chloroploca sp. Khr17 TaxID=2496869 RepID=UPI00101DB9AB|nr:type II toxin-antitoxin system PemK/MazF family toxin [Candidatus Chloroploca sp. Khr17]